MGITMRMFFFPSIILICCSCRSTPFKHASSGNAAALAKILGRRPSLVSVRDERGKALLHVCANSGIAELLFARGAEVNVTDNEGNTPLHDVLKASVAKVLLQHEPRINARNQRGSTALHTAAKRDGLQIMKLLIKNRADVNAKDANGWTALHTAAKRNNLQMMKLLIKNRADVNAKDANGWAPLHVAALVWTAKGWVDCLLQMQSTFFMFLQEKGEIGHLNYLKEEVKKQGQMIEKGQMISLGCPHTFEKKVGDAARAAQLLIDARAKVNIKDDQGCTPLHIAALRWVPDISRSSSGLTSSGTFASVLIANGADIKAKDKHGDTPLFFAETPATAKMLVKAGARINARNERGETPLLASFFNGRPNVTRFLLEAGANVNVTDKDGWTLLHYVVSSPFPSTYLAVKLTEAAREYRLFWAHSIGIGRGISISDESRRKTAKILVEAGAAINKKNLDGNTPLDQILGIRAQRPILIRAQDIISFLRKHGAKTSAELAKEKKQD